MAWLELQIGFRILHFFMDLYRNCFYPEIKIVVIGNNVMQQICNFKGDIFSNIFFLLYKYSTYIYCEYTTTESINTNIT